MLDSPAGPLLRPGPVREALPVATGSPRWLRVAGCIGSGPLLMLAFPPYGLWPCAALGVALLACSLRGVGLRAGAGLGLIGGAAFFGPLLHWTGIYVGPVPWLLLVLLEAAFVALLGVALALVGTLRPVPWALAVACLWSLQESLRGRLPYGGFPWGRLGFAMADAPAAHLARVGGVPLVGFAVALTGGLLGAAALTLGSRGGRRTTRAGRDRGGSGRRRGTGPGGLALLALAVATLPRLLPFVAPAGADVDVALVQGDVPRAGLDFNAQREAVLRNHVARTHELALEVAAGTIARPDLVIWPENSSDIDPFDNPDAYALIEGAVREIGVPVLIGAVLDGPGRYVSNAGVVWDPVTGPGARYVKRHPVPFAEYIPMRSLARRFSSDVDRVQRDFVHGRSVGALDVAGVRLGDVICFEVGYDGLVRDVVDAGAQVVVVQTNNATFGHTPQTEQQLQMSRLRAQETGRAVLVAATSGVSAVVAADGTVEQRTSLFTPAVLHATVHLARGGDRTLATRIGTAPEWAAAAGALLVLLAGARSRMRATRRPRVAVRRSR